jgi:glycosyltransferase involved in cell wall biosynthesis
MTAISAAIIASDRHVHEDYLGVTLESIKGSVDEVVLVRTGNGKVSYKPEVDTLGYHEWDWDFSAARNAALDLASGKWILTIDCGEFIDDNHRGMLHNHLAENPGPEGWAFDVLIEDKNGIYKEKPSYRLFTKRKEHRYKDFVHNRLDPVGKRGSTNLTIVHPYHEVDVESRRKRNEMFIGKLIDHVRANPMDARAHVNLIKLLYINEEWAMLLEYAVPFERRIMVGTNPFVLEAIAAAEEAMSDA